MWCGVCLVVVVRTVCMIRVSLHTYPPGASNEGDPALMAGFTRALFLPCLTEARGSWK